MIPFEVRYLVCQFLIMLSHSSFLLKSHNSLHERIGVRLNLFVSLSTNV